MTNRTTKWALVALFAFLASCGGGCAGSAARTNVLLPAMQKAWTGIREQAVRSAGSETEAIRHADAAVATPTPASWAIVDWPAIDALVTSDIDTRLQFGQIGPTVAKILRDRLTEFQKARESFAGAMTTTASPGGN